MSTAIPIIDILSDAASQASKLAVTYFKQRLTPQYKSSNQDLVTQADIESQKCIQAVITKRMGDVGIDSSEIGFIGEESGLHEKGKYLFAIDPIDGTTNFASGIEYFVISIGCFVDGKLMYGLLYEPMTHTTYYATKDHGAYKINRDGETQLSMVPKELKDSMVATYIHTKVELREREFNFIKDIFPSVRGVRLMGAGALDLSKVADNVFQVCMFEKSNIWDIAAATLLIQEAGGVIVSSTGEKIVFDLTNPAKIYSIVSCHPDNLEKILHFLQ